MRKHNAVGWYDKVTAEQKALARKIADKALAELKKVKGIYNGMLIGHTFMAAKDFGAVVQTGVSTKVVRGYRSTVALAFTLVVDEHMRWYGSPEWRKTQTQTLVQGSYRKRA